CARVSSRDIFAQETLESLSKTIEQLGVLEPLIVRASLKNNNQYEIIAGERRFRAAKLAGLSFVPCLLSNYSNEQSAQIALIENTHREALNLIAEALAMKRLAEDFRYTHDEIGVLLGVSRAQVTNYLRLLILEARVQHWMKQGALSAAHGKILAGVKYEDQYAFAYDAISKPWSVHMLDKMIKAAAEKKSGVGISKIKINPNKNINLEKEIALLNFPTSNTNNTINNISENTSVSTAPDATPSISLVALEQKLSHKFKSPVTITLNQNDTGSFNIHFHNRADMHAILQKLNCDDAI
ncbi:MAG: hypothetical protein A3E53_03000, partial [Gammaproteobacteria bacterium RIFCSPHIGHO2_12_FULL_39_24]